jgi:hypothetical protein
VVKNKAILGNNVRILGKKDKGENKSRQFQGLAFS